MTGKPELLSPAGNWDCARAAVANGADAVYFGLPRFNARMRADNFEPDEIPKLVSFLHQHGVRAYVAFNTLIFTSELKAAAQELMNLNRAEVDAIIVQDIGLAKLAQKMVPEMAIHASTQMTITSPEGLEFISQLGMQRVVLARELSLREMGKFDQNNFAKNAELEVFVHGALCVAYSGQCLTSESFGQRSANRGECAQACRLPYEMVVDGLVRDLGDRRYLLSPQDLAAVKEIPQLIALGIKSFKIEGRLKSPEYVAAVTQVYRQAIDAACEKKTHESQQEERYQLEMAFSRGLYSGWMHGVNHQELVHGRFGKKRGALVGRVEKVAVDHVEVHLKTNIKPGDGVVFDTGGNTENEQGGRVYQVKGKKLYFEHDRIRFSEIRKGDLIWKTDDPKLNRRLRATFSGNISGRKQIVSFQVEGTIGGNLHVRACCEGQEYLTQSRMVLQPAVKHPLTQHTLEQYFRRLGGTGFEWGGLNCQLGAGAILPVSELNRLRREVVQMLAIEMRRQYARSEHPEGLEEWMHQIEKKRAKTEVLISQSEVKLFTLCRSIEQIRAAIDGGCQMIYVDFEDIRRYHEAVALAHSHAVKIFLATPRIQKAGEEGFFRFIEKTAPDGILIRNLGALKFFKQSSFVKVGDFSLNVSNPLTADVLKEHGLERLTISYDLNVDQVQDLLNKTPAEWLELTLHQHMPMFHMEHCVFAAFLSQGTDHTNCGRPCDRHDVRLRDRVGMEHPVSADVGCRNTVFHARPQSGANYWRQFHEQGLKHFRIELLRESYFDAREVLEGYFALVNGLITPAELTSRLRTVHQLGVTGGTLLTLS